MITLKNVNKSYGEGDNSTQVLQNISLTIKKGEMVAIMGKSGSGKSTLLHILGTLDQITSGEYWFQGENITYIQGKELALFRSQSIGFVFQSYFLLPHKNALNNVMVPLLYSSRFQSCAKERAQEMLDKVDMSDRLDHNPSTLSGGQCQRVAIARALVNKPSIILADEPTGALDSVTGDSIIALFRALNKEGQTIIMVTHDEQIGNACDRCIHIVDGKIQGQ